MPFMVNLNAGVLFYFLCDLHLLFGQKKVVRGADQIVLGLFGDSRSDEALHLLGLRLHQGLDFLVSYFYFLLQLLFN